VTDLDLDRLRGLEAVLFLADHPLDVPTLTVALDCTEEAVQPLLDELAQRLEERQSGLTLRNVAGGWRLYTASETREHVERHLLAGRTGRLSQAALETLAVIAYKQPISRTEVGEIRGVNADGAVKSLVSRGLIEEVGRDDGPGQAVLYGTTTEFLEKIGLDSLSDLPSLTDYLIENPAPDEPTPDQLKEARRRLQAGRELSSTGASRWDPDAPEPDAQELVERARRERTEHALRRRVQEDEMDELTGALDRVARNAMAQLRDAVAATEEPDATDEQPDASDEATAENTSEGTASGDGGADGGGADGGGTGGGGPGGGATGAEVSEAAAPDQAQAGSS
jgi:segregation and condensation protein B